MKVSLVSSLSDRLSPEDLARWQRALGGLQVAEAIREFVAAELVERYGLSAADRLTQDGRILRGSPQREQGSPGSGEPGG